MFSTKSEEYFTLIHTYMYIFLKHPQIQCISTTNRALYRKEIASMGRNKNWRDNYYDENTATDRERQEYYGRHSEKIPVGCSACGGPYPSCCDSCPMFDD